MSLIYDVDANSLISKTACELKKIQAMKPPVWAMFCKTGMHKERPPVQSDWWHVRAASLLRTVAIKGPIGVSKLRTKYGGRKNRGHKPDQFYRGSGNIIRTIFHQLEKADLIKQAPKEAAHKGRIISPKGRSLLDKTALALLKAAPRPKPKPQPAETPAQASAAVPATEQKPAEEKKKKISIQA